MSDRKYSLILTDEQVRQRAAWLLSKAPLGYAVEIKPVTRSIEQNAKLWPMLTDVERAKPEGRDHLAEDWKTLFMHDLGRELRLLPALNGGGFVPLGYSTRVLSKRDFSDLIEAIYAYGSEHGVRWSEPMERAA